MNKVLLCTHESDVDGIGNVILGKLAFNDFEYKLYHDVEDLETSFRNLITSNYLDKFDKIYITDLSLYEPSISMVNDSNLKDKVLIFDHHQRAINAGLNKYPFTTIIEEDETGKRCGTELFYKYLINNNYLENKKSIETFVEYTRQEDTWDWKRYGEDGKSAHRLGTLFNLIGRDKYIDLMYEKLKNNDIFFYTKEELQLIEAKEKEYSSRLKEITDSMEIYTDNFDNRFGAVFSPYQYRNEIPEYIEEKGNKNNIKYIVIVAMDKGDYGQKSYRRIDDSIDCNIITSQYNGGGHPAGGAVVITKNQNEQMKKMQKKEALKYIINSAYEKE